MPAIFNAVTSCPRALAAGIPATGTLQTVAGVENLYNYLSIPFAAQNLYVDPITGASDIPTCSAPLGVGCHLPSPGNGRNHFLGPDNYSLNLGVYKNFAITERVKMQFRGEFYNVLNHHNFYVVTSATDAGNCTTLAFSAVNACDPSAGPITPIQLKKGSPGGVAGGTLGFPDERRNIQLALRFEF